MAGARPAASIATAWAVLNFLGVDGYTEIMRGLMETTAKVRAGIASIDSLEIIGDPIEPVLSFRSDTIDLYAVADVMSDRRWSLNRNTEPRSLHLMLSPAHAPAADELLSDLRDAVGHHGRSRGVRARYS
jgi:glutamate/tyrosine decarboxylase-like PLP-dependent enzyme